MPWPYHVAKAYHAADEATRQALLAVAANAKWGDVQFVHHDFKESPRLLRSLPMAKQCKYFGERLTLEEVKEKELAGCRSCSGIVPPYHCTLPGAKKFNDGPYTRGTDCMNCTDWQRHEKPAEDAGFSWEPVVLNHTNLFPSSPGMRFNPSIIESGDDYIFAWRDGWAGSNINACRLDRQFKPYGECRKLELGRKGSNVGREDVRLFRLNGKLHVSFTGYTGRSTNVLFARVDENELTVQDVFLPVLPGRQSWEKNWTAIDYNGVAHFVYSINPHRIVKVEGNRAEWAYETPFKGSWDGGPMRGGATPYLHEGNHWHFFHGCTNQPNGRRLYNVGVVVFKPEPPFEIIKYTPSPIDVADPSVTPPGQYCDVIFPGGALFRDGRWVVALGVADRWSEIRFYDAAEIESQLISV